MKVFEQELEKAGNKKKRILFSIGLEEIELVHTFLSKELQFYPEIKDPEGYKRIKNMVRTLAIYLGRKVERRPYFAETPCEICKRKVRGQKALISHMKDVHPNIKI